MNLQGLLLLSMLLCIVMLTDADPKKSKVFLHNYKDYKNVCREMNWVPRCNKHPPKGCFGKVVAFHAVLSKHLHNIPVNSIIKFGDVQTNEGGGYNPATGKFTAPSDGVYSFSWTFNTNKGSIAYLSGYVDGKLTAPTGIYGQTSAWQSTSGHLVIKLKKGRQFWIQLSHATSKTIHENYTFLSGYRLSGC